MEEIDETEKTFFKAEGWVTDWKVGKGITNIIPDEAIWDALQLEFSQTQWKHTARDV